MHPITRFLSVLGAAASLCGCVSTNVRTDYDPAADFSRFHTYSWIGGTDMTGTGLLVNNLIDKRVKTIVGQQLAAKGLTEVAPGGKADLAVRYWVGVREKTEVDSIPSSRIGVGFGGFGPYWGGHWGVAYNDVIVRESHEGTLIVDLIDAGTKELAWRAYLVQTVDRSNDKTVKRAEANVAAAFAQYPPTAAKK